MDQKMETITTKTKLKKGDKAYILSRDAGKNKDPVIKETEIISVGRKYITIADAWETKFGIFHGNDKEHVCERSIAAYSNDLLFETKEDAMLYLRKRDLARSLIKDMTYSVMNKCTVQQLEQIRSILDDALASR